MVKIKIHRGTKQIGGTIIEIYTENTHIFIDFGSELNATPEDSTDKKMIEMIRQSSCDAVLFSHYHGDHIGLMQYIPEKNIRGKHIKLGIGNESRRVLINIHRTLADDAFGNNEAHKEMLQLLKDEKRWITLKNNTPFEVGDFTITPVRVDHSAYDAYMFIIQAEGKTIVHTGDYRSHGRLGANLFPNLSEALKKSRAEGNVDVLLTEGTMMARLDDDIMTEDQLQEKATNILSQKGNECAFLLCSSTNVESMASFWHAAVALGRRFYVNRYVYEQIEGYRRTAGKEDSRLRFNGAYYFESPRYINPKLDGGKTQLQYMRDHGGVMMIGITDAYKYRMDYFKDLNPLLIYSMWQGYIDENKYPDTYDDRYGRLVKEWRYEEIHTSGHADKTTIEEMIRTVAPKQGIIPIHTTKKELFKGLDIGDIKVIEMEDGDEYEV